MAKFVAILSTTILPVDGTYSVRTLQGAERQTCLESLAGVPNYIGHPDTKVMVEALGATPPPSKLFQGLEIGQSAVCLPIKQGLSDRAKLGYTNPHQVIEDLGTLDVRVLTRLE